MKAIMYKAKKDDSESHFILYGINARNANEFLNRVQETSDMDMECLGILQLKNRNDLATLLGGSNRSSYVKDIQKHDGANLGLAGDYQLIEFYNDAREAAQKLLWEHNFAEPRTFK
jgi:hypothetical protein